MTGEARQRTAHRHYIDLKTRAMKKFTPVEESGRWVPKCCICGEEDIDVLCFHQTKSTQTHQERYGGYGRKFLEAILHADVDKTEFEIRCANHHMKGHKKYPTP